MSYADKYIGATVRATNRTFGLRPAQAMGPDEIVTRIVDTYVLTVETDHGNIYSNGNFYVIRLRSGRSPVS